MVVMLLLVYEPSRFLRVTKKRKPKKMVEKSKRQKMSPQTRHRQTPGTPNQNRILSIRPNTSILGTYIRNCLKTELPPLY